MYSRIAMAALVIAAAGLTMQRARPQAPVSGPGCETCHAEIAANYRKTGMGRSFYRMQSASAPGQPFYHEASGSYIVMIERGGKYFQRRWQRGFDGAETSVDEKQIDFVMGSGNHVRTYLHLTSRNTLQELPLSWYAEKGGTWGMSPGFDLPDYPGSTRVVTYDCMFCHNAYPKIPPRHDQAGASPEFPPAMPEGIDCQRCHGPGQRHIAAASRPGSTAAEIRATIVNPKRLPADRALEVCLQCHLETTSANLPHAIRRVDRGPFSYVPGQPLGDFRIAFDRPGGNAERFEIAHEGYRMRESQCFRKSEGKLTCTTCHDPHNIARGEAAIARYNSICRNCHAAAFMQAVTSGAHTAAANCVSCHMPRRRTDDAVHVAMTDHLILARQPAGDLLADKPAAHESPSPYRGPVTPYYPEQIGGTPAQAALYSAVAQVRESSNLKEGLPLLAGLIEKYRPQPAQYYLDLAQGLAAAGEHTAAIPYFEESVRHAPGSAIMVRKLGNAQMEAGQLAKAESTLRRVTALTPRDAVAWGILGQVLSGASKSAEAKLAFAKAIALDPEVPEVHGSFGALLFESGDMVGAEREFREAIRLQPGVARMQANLASVLASRRENAEARYHFKESIRLKPDYADAHLNYARMLASANETDEAEKEVSAAVGANAGLAGAHQLWGSLLATRGDNEGAARELQTAVKLQPDLWRAQFELGVVLGRLRDYAGAEVHLRIAAQGTDPDAKASAQQLLKSLGR